MILLAVLFVFTSVMADGRNVMDVGYMHYTYNGRVYAPLDNPDNVLDIYESYDYTFLVSCHFDTGGVDVGFAIDSSGSMGTTLAGVRATISAFADGLADGGYDYRLGGCPFADSTRAMWDFDASTPHPVYEMTDDIVEFEAELAGCGPGGGADTPEEYLDATAALMRYYDWRLLAIRIIIGFTDAVFCEVTDACADCHSNETASGIITELLDGNFILFNITRTSLYTSTSVPPAPYHINWYQNSADTTGGSWYDLSTSWTLIFDEVIEFIRDYQSVSVAIINTESDTIYNVWGEFIAGPCFSLVDSPGVVDALPPGDTAIFVWRFEPIESMGCEIDTTAELCFITAFHSTDGIGVPNPDIVTGGCVYFGEDCGCNGTEAEMVYPPDYSITTCEDQYVEYTFGARCQLDTTSFYFKVKNNPSGSWIGYPWADDNVFINPEADGFMWSPADPLLFFEHGDTVTHELYILEDIAGLGLDASPSGHFIVDLEPPVYGLPYPEDGELMGGPPEYVYIDVTDDIAGVDPDSLWMSVDGSMILPSDPYLTFDGTTLELEVVGDHIDLFPAGDTIEICVGAMDLPDLDLCPPNSSSTCWSFVIDFLSLDLPERVVNPGESVNLPVIALQAARFSPDNFHIEIEYNPEVLVITGLTSVGAAITTAWTIEPLDTADGVLTIDAHGTAALDAGNDTLIMIQATPHEDARGGSFTVLDYVETGISIDSGAIGYEIIDNGWVLVEWSPEIWTTDLTFDSDTRPLDMVLTIGMIPGATDMYEAGLDIYQVPPPLSKTDAYFPLDDPAYPMFTRLQTDFRGDGAIPVVWQVVTVGEPGELTWTIGHLPDGILTLNGIYEMHHHSSYLYEANETLTIVYDRPSPTMTDIELCVGWNLVGFPAIPTVTVVPNVFPDAFFELYGYDAVAHGYFTTNNPEAGRGYWVWNGAADVYDIGGLPIDSYTYPLERGWNLVGCTQLVSATYSGDIIDLQTWDCGLGSYVSSSFIEAGKGYWALALTAGPFVVPGSRGPSKVAAPSWSGTLEFDGQSFNFGVGDMRNSAGIPPFGPEGEYQLNGALVFEDFDMGDLYTPNADSWTFRANDDGILTWNIARCPDLEVTVDGNTIPVEDGGFIALNKGDVAVFGLRSAIPSKFNVSVKPNPANAAFTVSIDLPEKSDIAVDLYNMLGQKVDCIAFGEYNAGTHRFRWVANENPSGVYLVRVDWGEGNDVSRVVLMK